MREIKGRRRLRGNNAWSVVGGERTLEHPLHRAESGVAQEEERFSVLVCFWFVFLKGSIFENNIEQKISEYRFHHLQLRLS